MEVANDAMSKKQRADSEGRSSNGSSDDEALTTFTSTSSAPITPLTQLPSAKLYDELQVFKMSEEELQSNGYPSWDVRNGVFFEPTRNNKKDWISNEEFRRKCARCLKLVILNPDRTLTAKNCRYHFRPKWDPETNKKQLQCCFQALGTSKGCQYKSSHVFTGAWEDTLSHFVTTPTSNGPNDYRSKRVYSLDVETVFTLNGLECGRVSLVDPTGKVILDTFVYPAYPIIDYNFEFSGLTSDDMVAAISLQECRQLLFQFVNEKTLLIGHSLESDLKALRLVHSNVVDTSVLYSQIKKSGKMMKLSLKNLASQHLNKSIQSGEGHSSIEDAAICMELLFKHHETMKKNELLD